MTLVVLQALLIITFILSITLAIKRAKTYREENGTYGSYKQYLTSVCFFTLAMFNFFALSFNKLGSVSWAITLLLIIGAGYFTKDLPPREKAGGE